MMPVWVFCLCSIYGFPFKNILPHYLCIHYMMTCYSIIVGVSDKLLNGLKNIINDLAMVSVYFFQALCTLKQGDFETRTSFKYLRDKSQLAFVCVDYTWFWFKCRFTNIMKWWNTTVLSEMNKENKCFSHSFFLLRSLTTTITKHMLGRVCVCT